MLQVYIKVLAEPHHGKAGAYRITVSSRYNSFSCVYSGSAADAQEYASNVRYQIEEHLLNLDLGSRT